MNKTHARVIFCNIEQYTLVVQFMDIVVQYTDI